jgi:hypothetical protein
MSAAPRSPWHLAADYIARLAEMKPGAGYGAPDGWRELVAEANAHKAEFDYQAWLALVELFRARKRELLEAIKGEESTEEEPTAVLPRCVEDFLAERGWAS